MLPRHILRLSRHCALLPKLIRPLGCHGIHGRLQLISSAGSKEQSRRRAKAPTAAECTLFAHAASVCLLMPECMCKTGPTASSGQVCALLA